MARKATHERSIADRVRVDRVLSERGSVVTRLGTERSTGLPVVVKEWRGRSVRPLPTAEPKRSVWTRLILPTDREDDGATIRIVRPFVDGEPLDSIVEGSRRSVPHALAVGLDLLRALDTLHGLGAVHGAVRPSNVIANVDGRAWLVDPAAAEPGAEDGDDVSLEAARYFAPERSGVLSEPVDPRADLYSVGVILFECLAGRPLLEATDTAELLRAQILGPSRSLRAAGVDVPRALDEIVDRLLRKDPRDRYATAAGALQDLLELERRMEADDPHPSFVIGTGDVRATLTEPGLVGRDDELAQIGGALVAGRRGRGMLVRVDAESGDGKTRILREVAAASAQRGDRVFRAEARELEAPRPFAILEELARAVLDAAENDPAFAEHLRGALGSWGTELRVVLPSLGRLLPADAPGAAQTPVYRLQESLAALFDALGTPGRPAVLLLDDCQWADELSLGVIGFWSADRRPGRFVTLLAAVRTDEVGDDHPTRSWVHAFSVTLGPLGHDETRALASSMGGRIPDPAHAVIEQLSHGRPFFINSVLRGMVESGALLPGRTGWEMDPDSLARLTSSGQAATLVTRRLGRLPDETLGFLSAAAVLGRDASVAETAGLAEIDEARAGAIVEDARRAGLIWPNERRDAFSFIHDKVREGALRRLGDAERRRLHLRAAASIESARPDDVFDLAYHYDQADAAYRAIPPALEAARLARDRQALESAETMLRIAARGIAEDDLAAAARVAEDLGEVLMLRGAYAESATWLERARSLAPAGSAAAVIQGRIGELAFKRGDVQTAGEAIERALEMIGYRVPRSALLLVPMLFGQIVIQLLHTALPRFFVGRRSLEQSSRDLLASRFHGRLGYAWWFDRGKLATLWTHLRSLNLAERYPPTPELAQAYSEHAPAMMLVPLHRRGLRYAQRSHAIRVELGDPWGQGQSLHFWGAGLYAASSFEASLERMHEALELLERTGDRWELNNCRLQIAMARYRLGDLAGAVEAGKQARRAGVEIGDAQARGIGLEVWAKASDGQVPAHLIGAELERSGEDVLTAASVMQAEGVRLLAVGESAAAVEAFDESQRLFRQAGRKNAGVSPVRPWLLTALRRSAEDAPVVDRHRRSTLLRRARSVARQAGRRARFYRNDLPHVLRERGHLAALAGRRRRAHARFARSLEIATKQGARAEALRTRASRGRVGQAFGWTAHVEDGARAERELDRLVAATGSLATPSRVTLSLVDRFDTILTHGRRIASALRPEEVEAASLAAAGALLRAEHSRMLRVGASELYDAETSELVDHPVARRAVAELRAVVTSDPAEGSALAAPILMRGRPVGCILVTHPEVSSLFGEEEERLLEFVCTLAGAALENAEGFEEVRSLTRTLERRVVERTAELARANHALTESLAWLESANEELRELDRLKDGFISMVSHELRTPLTAVVGFASTLLSIPGQLSPDEVRSSVEIIERQSLRLTRLVDNLLERSRLDRGTLHVSMASYDLRELLDRAIEELSELDAEVAIRSPEGIRVLTDPDCFTQIMINLLSNAEHHGRPPFAVEVESGADAVEIAVTDHGPGVPEGFRLRLFERFAQAETGPARMGMGLGLSIVSSLATGVGGAVHYEPNEPEGARFVVTLPSAP